jgi:hypothetical protein
VTVKVWPPAVMLPLRGDVVVFAATLKPTVPLPEPVAPLVIVSQAAEVVAVQAQLLPAVTLNVPVPPAAGADCPAADSV